MRQIYIAAVDTESNPTVAANHFDDQNPIKVSPYTAHPSSKSPSLHPSIHPSIPPSLPPSSSHGHLLAQSHYTHLAVLSLSLSLSFSHALYRLQGVPTIKLYIPTGKKGKPKVITYNGERKAKVLEREREREKERERERERVITHNGERKAKVLSLYPNARLRCFLSLSLSLWSCALSTMLRKRV
jgi:hypothetical protein